MLLFDYRGGWPAGLGVECDAGQPAGLREGEEQAFQNNEANLAADKISAALQGMDHPIACFRYMQSCFSGYRAGVTWIECLQN